MSTPDPASFLAEARTIAVLGIKPESRADQPAHWIPAYLKEAGYRVLPVPVRYPEVERILDVPVARSLGEIHEPVDILDVFRRPGDVPGHLEEILALRPRVVWFQSGCYHEPSARALEEAGIPVVHACIYVVHRGLHR